MTLRWIAIAAALGLACGHALAAPALTTTLAVESRAGQVLVHVTVHNAGRTTLYVPRALAADVHPLGRTFALAVEPGAAPIDYTGRMVKRGPIGPDDFVAIAPHATLRHTLDLTASYAFLPGEHRYTLTYAGGAVSDPRQLGPTHALAPAPAHFIHTAP